jgi:hypothetical protein
VLSVLLLTCTAAVAQGRTIIDAEPDPDEPPVVEAAPSDDPADHAPRAKPRQALPRPRQQPDAREQERAQRAVRGGACAGCVAGGLSSGVGVVAPLVVSSAQGNFGEGFPAASICAGVSGYACGACSSVGAFAGAFVGAMASDRDPLSLSPWIYLGVGLGAASLVLPLMAAFALQNVGGGQASSAAVLLWGGLTLAAGPAVVAATFISDVPQKIDDVE